MYKLLLHTWKRLSLGKTFQITILRFLNDQFLIGVTGVIFNDSEEVLLLKHSYRRVPWSLPGGYLKAGEHPKRGLEREIAEETNFKVKVEKIIKTVHDKETARIDICCVGIFKKGTFKKSEEVTEFGFFNLHKLPPLLDDQYKQIESANKRWKDLHSKPLFKRIRNIFSF